MQVLRGAQLRFQTNYGLVCLLDRGKLISVTDNNLDEFIIGKALACFLAAETAKPRDEQHWDDVQNAHAILKHICPGAAQAFERELEAAPLTSLADKKAPHLTLVT
jgi:hypothetical protein